MYCHYLQTCHTLKTKCKINSTRKEIKLSPKISHQKMVHARKQLAKKRSKRSQRKCSSRNASRESVTPDDAKSTWNCKLWPYLEMCKNYIFSWGGALTQDSCDTDDETIVTKKRSDGSCPAPTFRPPRRTCKSSLRSKEHDKKIDCMLEMIKEVMEYVKEQKRQTLERKRHAESMEDEHEEPNQCQASQSSIKTVTSLASQRSKKKVARETKKRRKPRTNRIEKKRIRWS